MLIKTLTFGITPSERCKEPVMHLRRLPERRHSVSHTQLHSCSWLLYRKWPHLRWQKLFIEALLSPAIKAMKQCLQKAAGGSQGIADVANTRSPWAAKKASFAMDALQASHVDSSSNSSPALADTPPAPAAGRSRRPAAQNVLIINQHCADQTNCCHDGPSPVGPDSVAPFIKTGRPTLRNLSTKSSDVSIPSTTSTSHLLAVTLLPLSLRP